MLYIPLYASFLSLLVLCLLTNNPKVVYTTRAIRAFDALRVLSCLALLALLPVFNITLVVPYVRACRLLPSVLIHLRFQTYTSLLAILKPSKPALQSHVTFVLFCTLATYTYRDIWPLLTYTQQPRDVLAWPLYLNLFFLAIGGLFIPLFVPRPYVPVDPDVRLCS